MKGGAWPKGVKEALGGLTIQEAFKKAVSDRKNKQEHKKNEKHQRNK